MGIPEWTVFLLLGCALGSAPTSWAAVDADGNHFLKECSFTRYPNLCVETMLGLGLGHQPADTVSAALLHKTISETKLPTLNFAEFSSQLENPEAQRARVATDYCEKLMSMSLKRLNQSLLALKDSPRKNKHDIQTWLSAALTFQQACKDSADAADGLGLTGNLMGQISDKMDYLSRLGSNALALVNQISSKPKISTSRHRLTEEQVFPNWVSARDRKLLQSNTIQANAIVAKDGSGNYDTISEAIKAASGNRFVIHVKSGVYQEKIHTNKDGITLIGDGKYSTVIVGHDSVAGGASMPDSATFTITGDGFIARDIGFQNTAGPQGEQALALNIASDHSVLYRCSIAGYQDTLYALALRQFYRECDIHGTVDFIFGNAASVFQNCDLVLRRPSGAYGVILANGRSDPGQNTGFSVQNCKIGVSSDYSHSISYLGRPWKQYSRAVIMESTIDGAIASRGWVQWPGTGSSSLNSLYFAEYSNAGPGAATSQRVQWPGFHVIGAEEAIKFTVGNFIAGMSWLPSTGVTFISGLK